MTITARQPSQQHRHDQEGHDVSSAMLTHADETLTARRDGPRTLAAPTALPAPASGAVTGLPCQENDADLWFAELPAEVEQAKELCGPCPLREACLAGALRRREPWGVWGGQLLLRGVVVPRKRPRGRPRKDEAAA